MFLSGDIPGFYFVMTYVPRTVDYSQDDNAFDLYTVHNPVTVKKYFPDIRIICLRDIASHFRKFLQVFYCLKDFIDKVGSVKNQNL